MIIRGNARNLPPPPRAETVLCTVTSPPYFQLRDYPCGPRQLGREATPEAYIAELVEVFREVRRVLRHDGVLWLVLGDANWGTNSRQRSLHHPVLKPKDLIGISWRVAVALQADGWYLRADVISAKPNPMPEPVRDRPTRFHVAEPDGLCILASSRPGDLVLDPFTGSGTVGEVADQASRRWVGLELSANYVVLARQRIAQVGLPF